MFVAVLLLYYFGRLYYFRRGAIFSVIRDAGRQHFSKFLASAKLESYLMRLYLASFLILSDITRRLGAQNEVKGDERTRRTKSRYPLSAHSTPQFE